MVFIIGPGRSSLLEFENKGSTGCLIDAVGSWQMKLPMPKSERAY